MSDNDTGAPDIPPDNDLHQLAMQIRYDLTAAQGKLTELMRQIGAANIESRPTSNWNGPVAYEPGKLKHIALAEALWTSTHGKAATRLEQVGAFLDDVTGNRDETHEHLDELRRRHKLADVTPDTAPATLSDTP